MSIWEYANPKRFMQTSALILPVVTVAALVTLVIGLTWGFFFTPNADKFGSTVKIIYLHVPSAMMAISAWMMMLVASLIWLIRRHHVSALSAKAVAVSARRMQSCWTNSSRGRATSSAQTATASSRHGRRSTTASSYAPPAAACTAGPLTHHFPKL